MQPLKFTEHHANSITMRVAEQGSGPLVLFCHGFPESWYSWRHQLAAVAQAGYRAVAPDMRGYGATEAPPDVAQYTMLHLVGDMVELVKALGEQQARMRRKTHQRGVDAIDAGARHQANE